MKIPFDLKNKRIVLIADCTFTSERDFDLESNKLEMISDEYFTSIFNSLKAISKDVVHYQTPRELIMCAHLHCDDIVITIYGGTNSRNRGAFIPAICESYGIRYVGADAYVRILCQDKFLSKQYAQKYGIKCPAGILITDEIDIGALEALKLPLVVKPNFEGGSIGIGDESTVFSYDQAIAIIKKLKLKFNDSIIVEEFIGGREVCVCIVGTPENASLLKVVEIYSQEDEHFLHDRLYSAQEKYMPSRTFLHRDVTSEIKSEELEKIKHLFKELGKVDYLRIDGRLNGDGFTLIELTPDSYLGEGCAMSDAASFVGMPHPDFLKSIFETLSENHENITSQEKY